jgi:hypothetical protein
LPATASPACLALSSVPLERGRAVVAAIVAP